jgi:hypothetical protein
MYFMNWPTIPGQKRSLSRRHPLAHPPFGELGDDDRIVDKHADRQDQAE